MRRAVGPVCCAVLLAAAPTRAHADGFWAHFGDGKAELDGYALTQPRYGANRDGTAVLIFVTEDFSEGARVKADKPGPKVFPVLKLNFVRDFQTGIYDYNVMTSIFARVDPSPSNDPPLFPAKVSFSSQEWCGHVYQQCLLRGHLMACDSHSYFEGEADRPAYGATYPEGGVLEDAVPILVRGLRGDWLAPGASMTVPYLFSSLRERLLHRPQTWGQATITRSAATRPIASSALGATAAFDYTVAEQGGPTTVWTVEAEWPHRILAWRSDDGDAGRLLGSARLPYWQLNHPGDEKNLRRLGLPVPTPRGPRAPDAARP